MASDKHKFVKSIQNFINTIEGFQDVVEDPEFSRYIAHEIAKVAVKQAKLNVLNGGTDKSRRVHSRNTPYMTESFSKNSRQTGKVLYETGSLYKSIKIVTSLVSFGKVIVEVGIKDPKIARIAELNEFGGYTDDQFSIYIPPRPFLIPAVEEATQLAFDTTQLKKAIQDAIFAKMNGKDWKKAFKSVMPSK